MRFLLLILLFCFSCSPYKFNISRIDSPNGQVKVKVPKKYSNKETFVDSLGNKHQVFHYSGNAELYISEIIDSIHQGNSYIDTSMNIPRLHFTGGQVFKGMLPGPLFWREIRMNGLRVGYRNVSSDNEIVFDTSTNNISKELMKAKLPKR